HLAGYRNGHIFLLRQKAQPSAGGSAASTRGYGLTVAQSARTPEEQIERGNLDDMENVVVIEVQVTSECRPLHRQANERYQHAGCNPFHRAVFPLNIGGVNP